MHRAPSASRGDAYTTASREGIVQTKNRPSVGSEAQLHCLLSGVRHCADCATRARAPGSGLAHEALKILLAPPFNLLLTPEPLYLTITFEPSPTSLRIALGAAGGGVAPTRMR